EDGARAHEEQSRHFGPGGHAEKRRGQQPPSVCLRSREWGVGSGKWGMGKRPTIPDSRFLTTSTHSRLPIPHSRLPIPHSRLTLVLSIPKNPQRIDAEKSETRRAYIHIGRFAQPEDQRVR